jgi:hypothetical protein
MLLAACAPTQETPTPSLSYGGGQITEAQYVGIVRAVRECMVELGYDVTEVEPRRDGVTYGFGISGRGSTGLQSDGRTASAPDDQVVCEEQYGLMEAELAIQDQQALTGAELEAVFADFAACLEAAGLAGVGSGDSARDAQEAMDRFVEAGGDGEPVGACWTQYASQLFGSGG